MTVPFDEGGYRTTPAPAMRDNALLVAEKN
jgi:hypothetical protein